MIYHILKPDVTIAKIFERDFNSIIKSCYCENFNIYSSDETVLEYSSLPHTAKYLRPEICKNCMNRVSPLLELAFTEL